MFITKSSFPFRRSGLSKLSLGFAELVFSFTEIASFFISLNPHIADPAGVNWDSVKLYDT